PPNRWLPTSTSSLFPLLQGPAAPNRLYCMTRAPLLAVVASALSLFAVQSAYGQGCVVSRSNGEVGGPTSAGGYLNPGDFDINIGYRHQFSFRHFVGDVEQKQRIANGNQVMNKLNLENVAVTYQITDRFSATAIL